MINNEFSENLENENYQIKYGIGFVNFIENKKNVTIWFKYSKFLLFVSKKRIKIVHFKKEDQFYSYVICFFGLIIDID